MAKAKEKPVDIGAKASAKIEGIGVLRFSVDIIQKPLDMEFKEIEDLFRGKSRLTRDPKIFEVKVVGRKMDTRIFGAINDRARAAARNGMMEALHAYVLPDTPMNPEYFIDWDLLPSDYYEDPEFTEAVNRYYPRATQIYGKTQYAEVVASYQGIYDTPRLSTAVDYNTFFELSGGQGTFFMNGHNERHRDLGGDSRELIPYVATARGDKGPGVAGYRISEGGTPYSGKNYRVYIYYGADPVSAEYALKVHDTFPVGRGGMFLYKNHAKIKAAVLDHITTAFKGVKKYSDFTEKIGASFSLAATKAKRVRKK